MSQTDQNVPQNAAPAPQAATPVPQPYQDALTDSTPGLTPEQWAALARQGQQAPTSPFNVGNENARINAANQEIASRSKSFGPAFALWWFTGIFGGHRFYLGDTGIALGQLFTLGGLGIWTLVDVFLLSGRIREVNEAMRREVNTKYGIPSF